MTKQAERLEFLTKKENVPIVMEILQEGDRIRLLLFNQFMAGLKDYLQVNMTIPQDECELSVTEETDNSWASVDLWSTKLSRDNQYLYFRVRHTADDDCEMTLCLEWADYDNVPKEPKVQKLKALAQLSEHLKAEGLNKKGRVRLRYRYIRKDDTTDDFLATIIDQENRDSLYRQVSDCFWPLVQSTFKMIAMTNEDIAKEIGR